MSTRQCSLCNNNGHNCRTCPNMKSVKLFGVRLTEAIRPDVRKSASTGNIAALLSGANPDHAAGGYATDHGQPSSSDGINSTAKRGIPWSEEEHRRFLEGLQNLGKGNWHGISRIFVLTRTPTQVASHAQKHFNRQQNAFRSRRRSSLFDMIPHMAEGSFQAPEQQENPPPKLKPCRPLLNECIPYRSIPLPVVSRFYRAPMPTICSPMLIAPNQEMRQTPTIFKPTPTLHKQRKGPDVITDMSRLSVGEARKSLIGLPEQ